ncbi:MAG: hypothetical protein ACXAEL_02270 [Candidatus Hodarchaeales archaeon]|jgi:ribosomal protein S25
MLNKVFRSEQAVTYEFDRKTRKKRRWGRVYEYSSYERKIVINENAYDELVETIADEMSKSKGMTAQEIADKHDIRVSVAKRILGTLEEDGKAQLLVSGQNIKVYGPV